MSNPVFEAKEKLYALITKALHGAMDAGDLPVCEEPPAFVVEIPADTSHGDFATNAAMVGARAFHAAPRKIAQALCDHLDLDGSGFDRVEIAGRALSTFSWAASGFPGW